jgi:hypothetical protein
MEGVVSEDLRSSETSYDRSERLISFDFISSINIVASSRDIESDPPGSPGHFVRSIEGFVSECSRSSGMESSQSGKPISFVLVDSIHVSLSAAVFGTEVPALWACLGEIPSYDLTESRDYSFSRQTSLSGKWSDSAVMIETEGFSFSERFDSPLDQAEESMTAWIGVTSSLAGILLVVAGVLVLLGCRPLSFSSLTSLPESEIEAFTDGQFELSEPDPFLSEQNALSTGVLVE